MKIIDDQIFCTRKGLILIQEKKQNMTMIKVFQSRYLDIKLVFEHVSISVEYEVNRGS